MANVPTTSWAETTPAGSDLMSTVDNRIRELKTQIREVVGVEHDFPSSGQATDNGQHLRCTFQEQADLGTGAVSATILGSQTVSGKGELVYTDEDDNDIQLTSGGKLHSAVDGLSAGLKEAIFNFILPVGKVITLGVSTNPNTLYGFGTWTAIAGKVIVGIDGTQTEFDTLDETGGAKTHTLTTDEMPAHTHDIVITGNDAALNNIHNASTTPQGTVQTGSTGGGQAHNNLQPYIVKYCWQRVS